MGKASGRKRLRRNNNAPPSFGSKGAFGAGIWSQLVLALVALMLLGASLGLLVFSVGPTVCDWARMRQWEPVPAQVESARLHKGRKARGAPYYAAVVRYRYQSEGTLYIGTRAAVDDTGDSSRSFHQQIVDRLQSAQRAGAPVQVWVNPQNPAESVVDRSLRGAPLAWNLLIAAFAGGAGLIVLVMAVGALRQERRDRKKEPGTAKSAS